MNTYEQFLESERGTRPIRAAVVVAALGSSAFLSFNSFSEAPFPLALAVPGAYAAWYVFVRLVWLARCRSSRRVYVMLGVEAALAAFALWTFGLASPAIALPIALVPYFGHLLGRVGAYTASVAGLGAALVVVPFSGVGGASNEVSVIVAAAISIGAVGGIVGLIADERFREFSSKEAAANLAGQGARSSRLVQAMLGMSSAKGDDAVSKALADGMLIATGYPTAVILSFRASDNSFVPSAVSSSRPGLAFESIPIEAAEDHTASGRAVRQGSVIAVGADGLSADLLPTWATEQGYRSGIAAPITRGMDVLGVVYLLHSEVQAPSIEALEQAEMLIGFAARLFSTGSVPAVSSHVAELDEILSRAGRGATPDEKSPIDLPGMKLDPVAEKSVIGGVGVSLSRTEFSMLYALAGSAGNVVAPSHLLSACWDDGSAPNAGAVDVTVYRLRRKLAKTPGGKGIVRTVRGKGYMLVPPDASS